MSQQPDDGLHAVARLYYTGGTGRRYKRASTQDGPGEALCFLSSARYALQRKDAEIADLRAQVERLRVEADDHLADLKDAAEKVERLQAAGQVAASATVPISEHEAGRLAGEHWLHPLRFIRAVEAHHGIGLQAAGQVVDVSDEQIDAVSLDQWGPHYGAPLAAHRAYARAILALRPIATPAQEAADTGADWPKPSQWDSPLSDFQDGQWWVKELDSMASAGGTPDQKRAVAVVHHLLRAALAALAAQALPAAEPWDAQPFNAPVYPPDGTKSPFTVINLGLGKVQMGDSIHDRRLPALWFGANGQGMGHEEIMNREAKPGETLAVVTFANVEGLDVLLEAVQRIRRESFPQAAQQAAQATAGWLSQAATDLLAERQRQVSAEGWTPEHDDEHGHGEMARAAASYAAHAASQASEHPGISLALHSMTIGLWPWSPEWNKPTTERRNLIKAGALILAELERLDRAAALPQPQPQSAQAKGDAA